MKTFEQHSSDKNVTFSDMVGFSKFLLKASDFGNKVRYIYIESKDDFIDDNGNRYSWEDLYKIYKK
jgi:hypothetical protein